VGSGELTRQRHDPGGALQRQARWQAHRRNPLLRNESQGHSQGPATSRERPLEYRELLALARDTQLKKDAHCYCETNGVRILATLRSLAMKALRLNGFWSITEGLAALAHDIPGFFHC